MPRTAIVACDGCSEASAPPLAGLWRELMGMIVLPYLGAGSGAARAEPTGVAPVGGPSSARGLSDGPTGMIRWRVCRCG